VRDDDTGDVAAIDVVRDARSEPAPDREAHVLAVDLRDLLGLQVEPGERRNRGDDAIDADLRRTVADVVGRVGRGAGERSAGAQDDDSRSVVLHFS